MTCIHVRYEIPFTGKLLTSGECMQDQVLEAQDPASRSCDVYELLRLFFRGSIRAILHKVFEDVGDTEDCVRVLLTRQRDRTSRKVFGTIPGKHFQET